MLLGSANCSVRMEFNSDTLIEEVGFSWEIVSSFLTIIIVQLIILKNMFIYSKQYAYIKSSIMF